MIKEMQLLLLDEMSAYRRLVMKIALFYKQNREKPSALYKRLAF
jgi:hypothetical protein